MYLAFKYRLYPFPDQRQELLRQFEELRFLWNHALEMRIEAWRNDKRSVGYVDQCRALARWRAHDKDGIGRVYGHVAQENLARLDGAYKHFFRRVKAGGKPGHPRFTREVASLCYPDSNGSHAIVRGRNGTWRLHLSGIGEVPVRLHRAVPEGRPKTCTVSREGDRWFCSLMYEVADAAPPPPTPAVAPVGIDLGLSHLAALSTSEMVDAPQFLRRREVLLKRAQRKLSRKHRGSGKWRRQKVRVARCHAKARDQRRDFAHKLTAGWARRHDLVAFEDQDVPSMLGNPHLSKSISDAAWGMLRQMSKYKEERRSGRHVEVPASGTTQTCSECGLKADPPLTLKDRRFRCPRGHDADRDLNAARNILARALGRVPGGTGESTPVETRPPPLRKGRRVRSWKREPPRGSEVAR